jgi:hypothetical protein
MKRWIVIFSVALFAGCASINPFIKKPEPEPEVLPAEKWKALELANAQRIAGEGIPRADATTQPAQSNWQEFTGLVHFVFVDFPMRVYDFWTGNTPGKFARWMEDDQSADNRRKGIYGLVTKHEFSRKEPYTKRYWQISQGDPDYLVRVAAIRALNRSRDKSVVPVAIKSLESAEPLVRLEAAKALANIPDASAVPALLTHLNPEVALRGEGGRLERVTETSDVRVACADALRNYRTRDVARALIEKLQDKQFEVSWQARQSLVLMTGHDYRYDMNKWQEYLTRNPNL